MEDIKKKIESIFSGVEDPRVVGRCLHKLSDILFISFCTLLSNGEDFEDMEEFGYQREVWFKEVLELPNGIPSHDTFNRVFQAIDPSSLKQLLDRDGRQLLDCLEKKQLVLDGKKLKGVSPKSKGNNGLWILNAWVAENKLCIGQIRVDGKSNEIKAIPELLDELEVSGATITIDAIGCQRTIASKIIESKANYLLAVKGNQGTLLEMIKEAFVDNQVNKTDKNWDYGHGRYEERVCKILSAPQVWTKDFCSQWPELETLVKVESLRLEGEKESRKIRYYISSEKEQNPIYFNQLVRGHWGIENHLHWHLDVTFREDASRARRINAGENLSILRKMALHRISKMDDKLSLKKRRFRAALNNDYFLKLLFL
jgi:predicted transposase YbfD/YdcC